MIKTDFACKPLCCYKGHDECLNWDHLVGRTFLIPVYLLLHSSLASGTSVLSCNTKPNGLAFAKDQVAPVVPALSEGCFQFSRAMHFLKHVSASHKLSIDVHLSAAEHTPPLIMMERCASKLQHCKSTWLIGPSDKRGLQAEKTKIAHANVSLDVDSNKNLAYLVTHAEAYFIPSQCSHAHSCIPPCRTLPEVWWATGRSF